VDRPAPTSERIWLVYLACVAVVALCTSGGGSPGHDPVRFLVLHGVVTLAVLGCRWLALHRSHAAARVPRAAMAVAGLPVVFTGLCWLLPGVHPEPYEWSLAAADRTLFGTDVGRLADALPASIVEVLQVCYFAFYAICVFSAIAAGLGSGKAAFDRAVLRLVGGFLASYLGYLLVPTLAPKVVLSFDRAITGLWATSWLRSSIDSGEANPWDCFPSGHTMLTLVALANVWCWHRRVFWWLLGPGLLLIASTVLLRYHWTLDVLAGALLAWPAVWACDRLADRDGWPVAARRVKPAGT
jgi:membrane-associated phospholipid phosphatase